MRRAHTPSDRSGSPAEPGGEPHTDLQADLVAGDPPVPITVWRTPAGDDQASIPVRLAQRLVATYSRPGEVVVDVTDDHALTGAATDGGRRHHKGWFTDASALIIGPPTTPVDAGTDDPAAVGPADGSPRRRRRRTEADPLELAAWFGDDLTDPDLPPQRQHILGSVGFGTTTSPLLGADPVSGATGLVVTCWPLSAVDAGNRKRLRGLLRAAVALLRPAGCLVLVVRPPAAVPLVAPEDFGPLVAAAREAGLGYLQHIVAVRAEVSGDQFVYYATEEELLALAPDSEQWKVAHLRVHADLLVFTPRQTAAGSGRGGARG
jgi:hypothetical protein